MQKKLLHTFFNRLHSKAFEIIFWDKETLKYGKDTPKFKVTFHEKVALQKLLKHPVLAFCEAYMDGIIDIEGDFDEIIQLANQNKKAFKKKSFALIPKAATLSRQKKEVQHHYDIGNDFYALWLDESMSYSCAYFQSPETSLEKAQLDKIDHILKKLQLRSGERLLDIGCGWGALMIRAAQKYGVQAVGVTLSEEQFKKTQERIIELNLQNQVTVKLLDYRELDRNEQSFDKISSVGMFEHVGQANYPIFMEQIQHLLKDKGIALLHTITASKEEKINPWTEKYIFPGGYIPSLREIVTLLPNYDFHTLDIESLRMHYAMTLDHWSQRFENHLDQIKEMYDERFIRMWRLYLRFSSASFRLGRLNLHQILLSKGINNELFLTRDHLYT